MAGTGFYSTVKDTAQGRWLEILGALCPELQEACKAGGKRHVACPIHGGDADFRFCSKTADDRGLSFCSCGVRDGIQLIEEIRGTDFRATMRLIADYLGLSGKSWLEQRKIAYVAKKEADKKRAQREEADRHAAIYNENKALRIWNKCIPLESPEAALGRRYLHKRKLDPKVVSTGIRFHPRMPLYEDQQLIGHFPALVSMVFSNRKKPITLHRIYLDESTGKKLALAQKAKKLMPVANCTARENRGRVIPVIAREESKILGVAEGIETAIAANLIFGVPCWATVSAGPLVNFVPPEGIEKLVVFADQDHSGAGLEAALKLRQNLQELGWKGKVHIRLPPVEYIAKDAKGVDWADMWYQWGSIAYELKIVA